jgi:hypothetical protein
VSRGEYYDGRWIEDTRPWWLRLWHLVAIPWAITKWRPIRFRCAVLKHRLRDAAPLSTNPPKPGKYCPRCRSWFYRWPGEAWPT